MQLSSTARWRDGMTCDIDVRDHLVTVDAAGDAGGQNRGPRPKPLVLAALAGCTGMDVASLLKKMHVEFDSLAIEVEAETAEEHPRVFRKIHLRYIFTGGRLERDKMEKAVRLSQEQYCSVGAMLRKAAPITWEILENPPSPQ